MPTEAQIEKVRADGERQAAKLWRAFRTSLQMVHDRGYVLSEQELNISLDEFRNKFTGADGSIDIGRLRYSAMPSEDLIKRMTPEPENPSGPPADVGLIWVEFNAEENVGIKHLRAFAQHLTGGNFHTGILITQAHITAAALKIIPAVSGDVRIETFQDTDLLVNITHHELVPQHTLLSRTEKSALLKRYRLKETQLPRIQLADPVAKYYGLRRGQVVKIIRKSETAGRYASYRLCV